MRVAVVGHVEWVEFARVEEVPHAGEIVHAQDVWAQAAGGGAVAAAELARLAGGAAFFTALGDDELGRRAQADLESVGVSVHVNPRAEPQRRAFCFVDENAERTITLLGPKLHPRGEDGELPWEELARADGVYFTAGDEAALRQARRARVLVATARELPTLRAAGVELDVLVASGRDEGERYAAGDLDPPPRVVVSTAGPLGGWAQPGGPYKGGSPPPDVEDAYGCGDCFAAGLTYALAGGRELADALALASERGALQLARRGAATPEHRA